MNKDSSDSLIGAPFDGAAILNRLDNHHISNPGPSIQRQNVPPPLTKTGIDARLHAPALRSSASFHNMDPNAEKMAGPRAGDTAITSPKRYSDDGKDLKSAVLRKKSGFTGFMTSLVGSPKKPVISAPENPVHVTHVGYDSTTGQFTVSTALD